MKVNQSRTKSSNHLINLDLNLKFLTVVLILHSLDLVDKEELRLFKEQLDGQADSLVSYQNKFFQGLNKTLEQSLEALKFYKTIIEEINELNKKVLKVLILFH